MSDTIHVYPDGDIIEHVTVGDDCMCGPTSEAVPRDDGSYGWMLRHHALDGREFNEPDYTGQPMPAETP